MIYYIQRILIYLDRERESMVASSWNIFLHRHLQVVIYHKSILIHETAIKTIPIKTVASHVSVPISTQEKTGWAGFNTHHWDNRAMWPRLSTSYQVRWSSKCSSIISPVWMGSHLWSCWNRKSNDHCSINPLVIQLGNGKSTCWMDKYPAIMGWWFSTVIWVESQKIREWNPPCSHMYGPLPVTSQ